VVPGYFGIGRPLSFLGRRIFLLCSTVQGGMFQLNSQLTQQIYKIGGKTI